MASSGTIWPNWQENKLFTVLLAILIVYATVYLYEKITLTAREVATSGYAEQMAPTISVTGTGDASGSPDLRKVDVTMTADGVSADAAQNAHSEKIASFLAALDALAIGKKDIQTASYNVYPTYDYDVSPAVIVGYETSQTITVTMRDEKLVSSVLDVAGDNGASYISDVQLAIEDTTALENEARQEALADARSQASAIAAAMGASLGKPVSYYESTGGEYPVYFSEDSYASSDMRKSAPSIPEGENEVTITVSVTYAIE